MFGGAHNFFHTKCDRRLLLVGAFACFSLASILEEYWTPSDTVETRPKVVTKHFSPMYAGKPGDLLPVTRSLQTRLPSKLLTQNDPIRSTTPGNLLPQTSQFHATTPNNLFPQISQVHADGLADGLANGLTEGFDAGLAPRPATPTLPSKAVLTTFRQHTPVALKNDIPLPLASAKSLLAKHEVFGQLLHTGTFKRNDWQTFKHIELDGEPVTRQATLSPIPEITRHPDTSADNSVFTIMIDPGHGGWDPGSIAPNGLQEKHLTLDIARRVELFLSEVPDINVKLTRNEDISLRRNARVNKIKEADTDLVVSLHFNHLPQPSVNLVETFYAGPEEIAESLRLKHQADSGHFYQVSNAPIIDLSFARGSKRIAEMLHARVLSEVTRENAKTIDAGVKTDMLYVLTQSFTPGVLMELTCISNIAEAERLADDEYRNHLAAALADGIRNYRESLRTKPLKGTGT